MSESQMPEELEIKYRRIDMMGSTQEDDDTFLEEEEEEEDSEGESG